MTLTFSLVLPLIAAAYIPGFPAALGALYQDPSQLPTNASYDYIIVGGAFAHYASNHLIFNSTPYVLCLPM